MVRFRPKAPLKFADVAHLVERHLAKVEVASSSLVIRSILFVCGGVVFTMFKNWLCALAGIVFLSAVLSGCVFNHYNNNLSIATSENGSCYNWSGKLEDDNKTYSVQVGKLSGIRKLAVATVDEPGETKIKFSINVKKGKTKLVLVDPNLNVTVLKEVTSQNESEYHGDITLKCRKGQNILKIVGEDYEGNFRVSQEDSALFKYDAALLEEKMSELEDKLDNMFDDDFPFGSRQKDVSV